MQPKVNILFIEDEQNILTFVTKLLYGHNYKVTTAITGTEGLQLINSICPDLILLDLGLPDMDGQTIIRQVREWSDCPIIVISARTNEHEKVKALDLGADDYITKPFGSAELLARIRTSLRHSTRMNTSSDQLFHPYKCGELWNGVSEGGLSVDPDVLPARMRVSGNRNVSFVTHRKSDHCGSNNLWRFASDLSLGRTDRFPPDISCKRHDRYCGIRYHCGADHLPDDGKLDDRRNYRSDRSCCGCDRKLCKIFII